MIDIFKVFSDVSSEEKNEAIGVLIEHSAPRRDFFLMVILSVAMAVFGIYLDSIVVLIGSMLIAPVLYPVLTIALGIVISDVSLIKRSANTLWRSVFYGLVISGVIGLFLPLDTPTIPGIEGDSIIVVYALVAIASGIAASFAMAKPHLNESFPGVAVSVSLVPPLAFVGVGIAEWDWFLVQTYTVIFLVNVIGIIFASMVVFSLLNMSTKRDVAEHEIEKTNKIIESEKSE
jgi:uncharacterized hydrophobic protein (TIGR00271 family)